MSSADTRVEPHDPRDVKLLLSILATGVGLAILAQWISFPSRSTETAFLFGTSGLLAIGLFLCVAWPTSENGPGSKGHRVHHVLAWLVALSGGLFAAVTAHRFLPAVFAGRINSHDADMLVVIENGVDRVLHGMNPYVLYHVPWEVPLPYGPWLWAPYVLPHVVGMDPRVLTLVAHLVVPGACVWASAVCMTRRQPMTAICLLILASILMLHPRIAQFYPIGHTFVYWPLLFLFCWYLRNERWTAATIVCGSLVAARTTMLSLVPVLLLTLFFRRQLTVRRLILLCGAVLMPFVPFALLDWHSLRYAVFDSYLKVMKQFVWVHTDWAHNTYGLTGTLLRHGHSSYVEATQLCVMAVVYAMAAYALKRGARPEPWCALALLTFSMTTLWPVMYLYFDVFVLLAATLACHVLVDRHSSRTPMSTLAILLATASALVVLTAAIRPGASYAIDLGTAAAASLTGAGFGQDVPVIEGNRTFEWVEGETARIRLPRAGWTGSTIHVVARAYAPVPAPRQLVAAILNGHRLGGVKDLGQDWTDLSFQADRRVWYYGFNLLELRFSHAIVPSTIRDGSDTRALSAAVDTISVHSGRN